MRRPSGRGPTASPARAVNTSSAPVAGARSRLAGSLAVALMGAGLLFSCSGPPATPTPVGRGNPASQNCVARGGALSIERNGAGAEYGVCSFGDGRQCEEWAMLRGECPVGGIKVTGYVTPAARYCAITGGTYEATGAGNAAGERGTCTLASGKRCDAQAYHDGSCGR
ncbi:MAG TPA: DUF333 domain-containing protein [Candidatus Methylomirabilis sp.]|nr:DUF333 domain-containing protein [Candidatus Methylomirabilis sp.]